MTIAKARRVVRRHGLTAWEKNGRFYAMLTGNKCGEAIMSGLTPGDAKAKVLAITARPDRWYEETQSDDTLSIFY